MKNRKAVNAVAIVTTLAAWCGLYLSLHPRLPEIDRDPHVALGEVLAAEAVRLLEPGARLIVIARDPVPYRVLACAAQLDGFQRAIKKSGRSVASLRGYKLDPLRPVAVPPADFFDLLRRGQDNDVIVSFLGPPVLDADQLAKLGGKRPRILAVCSGTMPAQVDLKRLFDQKLLAVAVISRDDGVAPPASHSKPGAFERMFRLITPANLADLPQTATTGH